MKKLLPALGALVLSFTGFLLHAKAAGFSDANGHKYQTAIEFIADEGIVEGYSDGTFKPNEKINRAELLKIIMEANGFPTSGSDCFTDVKSEWYAQYVCAAKNAGVIQGYSDGSFKPGNNINFVETLKILEKGYGAQIQEGNPWYQNYVNEAEEKNLIPNDVYDYGTEITRGQMADMITRQLKYENGDQEEYINSLSSGGIVDTNQKSCYNATQPISCPSSGSFFGQDAQYQGLTPSYTDNGDGTVTDNNTGLMWLKDAGDKVYYYDGVAKADSFEYAGYDDWRVPTIKELYSLMDFSGKDIDPTSSSGGDPFIDDSAFVFEYGDTSSGDRIIDSQWITSTINVSKVMNNQECFFGVNFADGRIKCYPTQSEHNNGYFLRFVRGAENYGNNSYVDNGNGTISDGSSGLMWQEEDSGEGMDWEDALAYCEDLNLAGHSDWRLPNAKELEYIVDYTRSPDATNSPAIDPIFQTSSITNKMGEKDYPYFWTSTTHSNQAGGQHAAYIAFGRGLGYMNNQFMDVHGAGCQRSDPKTGSAEDYPSWGDPAPQGDVERVFNHARCVRNEADFTTDTEKDTSTSSSSSEAPSQPTGGQQPPQEAIDACSGKTTNASCSFQTPNGTITGTCLTPAGTLACVPQ